VEGARDPGRAGTDETRIRGKVAVFEFTALGTRVVREGEAAAAGGFVAITAVSEVHPGATAFQAVLLDANQQRLFLNSTGRILDRDVSIRPRSRFSSLVPNTSTSVHHELAGQHFNQCFGVNPNLS